MIAASSIAIFIVPVLFVVIVKIAYGKKQLEYLARHKTESKVEGNEEGKN
jgi:HAE1 family hydrophobic/amphiphilic exporter-1